MNKHLTINCRLWLTFLLCFILNAISYGQSNGTSLRSDITVEHIIEFPKEGFRNEPTRLVKDEVTGNLLYNEYGGTIWEIAINSPTPSFNFKYSLMFTGNLSNNLNNFILRKFTINWTSLIMKMAFIG